MSTGEGKTRDEILRDVAIGGLGADDPRVRTLSDSDPAFQGKLEGLTAMIDRLDATAALERQVIRESLRPEIPDSMGFGDQVERTLRLLSDQEDRPEPSARRFGRFPAVLITLAAACLVFVLVRAGAEREEITSPTDQPGQELMLGSDPIGQLTPRGNVEDFGSFRWAYEKEPGQRFELRILDATSGAEVLPPLFVEANEWTPRATTTDDWPDQIEWEVSVIDVLGEIELTSPRVRSSRSSR